MARVCLALLAMIAAACTGVVTQTSVPDQPTIQLSSAGPYVKTSSTIFLNCATNTTVAQAVYRFFWNSQLRAVQGYPSLIISRARGYQSGIYACTVSSSVGESKPSDGITITFVDPPTLTVSNNDVQAGGALNLTCSVSLQVEDMKFMWFKDKVIINGTAEKIYQITNAAMSEEGEYSCLFTFTNNTGGYSFESDKSGLFVLLLFVPGRPSLNISSNVISQGLTFEPRCIANSSTTVAGLQMSYLYFNGVKIAQTFAVIGYGIFVQAQILFRDAGNYACSFSNMRGESALSLPVSVTVQSWTPKPRNLSSISLVKTRGELNYISCLSSSLVYENYFCTLYLNGERYQEDQDCSFVLPHSITGTYSCSFTNANFSGPVESTQNITFVDAPEIKLLNQGNPALNQNYTLQCVTDQNVTFVYWYNRRYGGVPIASNTDILSLNLQGRSDPLLLYCKVQLRETDIWSNSYYLFFRSPTIQTFSGKNVGVIRLETAQYTVSFQFECYADNSEFYTLYKNGVRVSTATQNRLKIFRLGKLGANYTCTASNKYGESLHSNPIFVQGKDDVFISASAPKATLGQSLTLTCSVQNSSELNITYSWFTYRQDVDFWRHLDKVKEQSLTFNPVTQNDTGFYICGVEVDGKAMVAKKYYAIFASQPKKPEIKDIQIGSPDALFYWNSVPSDRYYVFGCTCFGLSCDPQNPFRLYKDGKEMKNVLFTNQLSNVFNFSVTRYYNVDITDPKNEGNYTCAAINSFAESEQSDIVIVSTKEVLRLLVDSPNAALGQDITFTCDVPPGIPDSNFEWKKSTKPFLRNVRTFSLSSLSREDDGGYTCSYTNLSGINDYNFKRRTSKTFYLILREPLQPLLVLDTENENPLSVYSQNSIFFIYGVGDTVFVKCISQQPYYDYNPYIGENDITYILYKNGQQVDTSNARGKFEISGLTAGAHNYTCKARNRIGDSPYSYTLTVNVAAGQPTITSSSSPTEGANLTLTCNTEQESDGSDIIWIKNTKVLSETSRHLSIAGLQQFDEGRFSCRQKIGPWYHPVSADYTLIWTRPATPEIFTPNDNAVDSGLPLRIYCLSASSTSSQAVFYRNGQAIKTIETEESDDAGQVLYTYSVLDATNEDSGDYTCTVQNSQGVSQNSEVLTITIMGGSTVTQQPSQEETKGTTPKNDACLPQHISLLLQIAMLVLLTLFKCL